MNIYLFLTFQNSIFMLKTPLLFTFLCLFCAFACTEIPKKDAPQAVKVETPTTVDVPIVGNDVDEHGCKPSAGFSWSVVKNECIQIFNSGIRLEAKAADVDKTTSAFIVFKSETDDAQAELYLPSEKKSILLAKDKKNGAGKWTNTDYVLSQWKGMYTLENSKKKVLYQGH